MGGCDGQSAIALAHKALKAKLRKCGNAGPRVRVQVINAARSTKLCRKKEQYAKTVRDRNRSALIQRKQTPWDICDLEDVVWSKANRNYHPETEACHLSNKKGLYASRNLCWILTRSAGD